MQTQGKTMQTEENTIRKQIFALYPFSAKVIRTGTLKTGQGLGREKV